MPGGRRRSHERGSVLSLYGSKARQVAGGFGVLPRAATTAAHLLLRRRPLRLRSDRHGGGGGRRELRDEQCGDDDHGDGLAGPAAPRRCGRVPEQREEDPQGARPNSQQVLLYLAVLLMTPWSMHALVFCVRLAFSS